MPRAKLTYDNRCWLEQALKEGMDPMKICEHLGIKRWVGSGIKRFTAPTRRSSN